MGPSYTLRGSSLFACFCLFQLALNVNGFSWFQIMIAKFTGFRACSSCSWFSLDLEGPSWSQLVLGGSSWPSCFSWFQLASSGSGLVLARFSSTQRSSCDVLCVPHKNENGRTFSSYVLPGFSWFYLNLIIGFSWFQLVLAGFCCFQVSQLVWDMLQGVSLILIHVIAFGFFAAEVKPLRART